MTKTQWALIVTLPLLVMAGVAAIMALTFEADLGTIQSKTVKIGVIQRETVDKFEKKKGKYSKVRKVVVQRYFGSGSVVSSDGVILTCSHILNGKDILKIFVKTQNDQVYYGRIVRIDHRLDLAVVKIDPVDPLPFFRLGRHVRVGDHIITAGAPMGIRPFVSFGRITGSLPVQGNRHILHSAPVAPGSSGGPLIDAYGRLIGVNVQMLTMDIFSVAPGFSVAVHINTIKEFLRN
jgi:S1-C subfamily serine protease